VLPKIATAFPVKLTTACASATVVTLIVDKEPILEPKDHILICLIEELC
jgi:hypothetical protein